MTFDEWYDANAKYMHPADLKAWMSEAWDAASQCEQDKFCALLRQLHDSISLASIPRLK